MENEPEARFSVHPRGTSADNEGASLTEAESLVGAVQALGKTPNGGAALLMMALAVVILDTNAPERQEQVIAVVPRLLRQMVAEIERQRTTTPTQ